MIINSILPFAFRIENMKIYELMNNMRISFLRGKTIINNLRIKYFLSFEMSNPILTMLNIKKNRPCKKTSKK